MAQLLIVEDQPGDMQTAVEVASSIGIFSVEARTTVRAATAYLEKLMEGELRLPDAILVDLDLPFEVGYELLRLRYTTPQLAKIPMIVWTHLHESCREVCELFKVNAIVFKWEGKEKLREALEIVQSQPANRFVA